MNFASKNSRYVKLTAITQAGNRGPCSSAADIEISYTQGSGADVIFSEPWASKYVLTLNISGTLDSRGLIIDDTHQSQSDCSIYQSPIPEYGCSVAVYFLSASKAYDFFVAKLGEPPILSAIGFQGPYWNPNNGRWVNWRTRIEDIGGSNMKLDLTAMNTVLVVTGESCVTVFSNGVFQFSNTTAFGEPITTLNPPKLVSYWTDIT